MALRLGELVVCGELRNVRKNSVHGWLGLRGIERPVTFELTGNCDRDLAGRHIRFEVQGKPDSTPPESSETAIETEAETETEKLERLKLAGLAWQQIGPTGTMTAARKVRVADCSPEELYARCKLDAPPPMDLKRCLYLEWFSQNGRVVVELVDPVIEFVVADQDQDIGEDNTDTDATADDDMPDTMEGGLSITSVRQNADGEFEIADETPFMDEMDDASDDDPYGLMPDDLQRQLDEQAREMDRSLGNDPDEPEIMRETRLLDDLIEHDPSEPLGLLFDEVLKLPSPDQLDDEQAEQALKIALASLALYGVAFNMCEHFTPLEAYRLLVKELCQEEHVYPQLRGTQWVQHFCTSDSCEKCAAEFEGR